MSFYKDHLPRTPEAYTIYPSLPDHGARFARMWERYNDNGASSAPLWAAMCASLIVAFIAFVVAL